MSEDRPAVDPVQAIADLQKRFDDLETTYAARMTRRPTGVIEVTLLDTPPAGALLLHGQTLSRVTYADLFRWASERGRVGANLPFGPGDGTTTFTLPDLRGKAAVGATVVDPTGKSFGSPSVTLTEAMLPRHRHPIADSGNHGHSGTTSHDGHHGGHFSPTETTPGGQFTGLGDNEFGSGGHSHGFGTSQSGNHDHGGFTDYAGSSTPTAFFVVQPSYAVQFMIWT